MKNILTYERYGKQNLIRKCFLDVKNRFKINKMTEEILNGHGIGVYVPKLNRTRFTIGLLLAGVCIITPIITFLSIPAILWGLK